MTRIISFIFFIQCLAPAALQAQTAVLDNGPPVVHKTLRVTNMRR
jgi:hypothetical protein